MAHLLVDDLPDDLLERLNRHSLEYSVSMSGFAQRAIERELERVEELERRGELSPRYCANGSGAEMLREERRLREEHLERVQREAAQHPPAG